MDITIYPQKLTGTISAIPSKSQAHRILICAAFSDQSTMVYCSETNQDIIATVSCLQALGADIMRTEHGYLVQPIRRLPKTAVLNCNESGSTLRFMLPIAGALGVDAVFQMSGRLPLRPLSPLWEEMERMGCHLTRPTQDTIRCTGKLISGNYTIPGNISSQYITGLLFAMALIEGFSQLIVTGKLESMPYVRMTQLVLSQFSVDTANLRVQGSFPFSSPGSICVEGDWSNGAFFLAAKQLGSALQIQGLDNSSPQGDRAVAELLPNLTHFCRICAADIPDLVPILAVVAGANCGAEFTHISRLRLKESDRVATVAAMLQNFGLPVDTTEDTLTVHPGSFQGCTIDACGDHRIAMAAAIGTTVAQGPVTILGAECVAKSYPAFWQEYKRLGGQYEQYIR